MKRGKAPIRLWCGQNLLGGLLVVFGLAPAAEAQVLYGSIIGNVTDASGGVVAGATVRITNRGTGVSNQIPTSDTGAYTFTNVAAGAYELSVTHSGFGAYTQRGIELNVDRKSVV